MGWHTNLDGRLEEADGPLVPKEMEDQHLLHDLGKLPPGTQGHEWRRVEGALRSRLGCYK